MTSLFFGLLPSDLQIDILSAWLNVTDCGCGLLKVLSALDVACSMSEQPSLRFLMGQLPPFGEYNADQYPYGQGNCFASHYLWWLAYRKVPMRSLVLMGNDEERMRAVGPNLTLPLIETLHWELAASADESVVLQCLPNLTAIHQTQSVVVNPTLTPNLKVLTMWNVPQFVGSCLQLQVLWIGRLTDELAGCLAEFCPNLTALEVSMWGMDFSNLRTVLCAYPRLRELVVHDIQSINMIEVVVSFPNIKRLTMMVLHPYRFSIEELISVFKLCSHLEYFMTDGFLYSRVDAKLQLPLLCVSTAQLSEILSNCSALEVLNWKLWLDPDAVTLLDDEYSFTLRSLTAGGHHQVMGYLLLRCGMSLRTLDLDFGTTKWRSLTIIAATCPRLVALTLWNFDNWEEETVLFAACRELKELKLIARFMSVDFSPVLRAILAHRLLLKVLKLKGALENTDVDWFRQQARDLQLLPIPEIILKL